MNACATGCITAEDPIRYPALPDGMQRSQLEALLVEIAPAIGLSGRRLQALLLMMAQTRPRDWVSADAEPVCYMAQTELARILGKTERAVRADEAALSGPLALIEKRTAANGGRSSYGRLGLVFSRLIARVPRLIALRDNIRQERQRRKELCRLRSAFYRQTKLGLMAAFAMAPHSADLCALRDAFLAWPGPDALRAMALADLEVHVTAARALCVAISDATEPETSGRPEVCDRPHLQDTTEENSVPCTAQKAPDAETVPGIGHSAGGFPTSDHEPGGGLARRGPNPAISLAPERIYRLCSDDMRLRLDIERQRSGGLRPLDIVVAAIKALPELGIHGSAWDEAADTMGEYGAALAMVITDANRTHPATPIRNPGGHLRAMTRAHRAGRLNLVGGLIGLEERRRLGQQER